MHQAKTYRHIPTRRTRAPESERAAFYDARPPKTALLAYLFVAADTRTTPLRGPQTPRCIVLSFTLCPQPQRSASSICQGRGTNFETVQRVLVNPRFKSKSTYSPPRA
eukprot:354459-Prorocentrum_minimum.AAC.2